MLNTHALTDNFSDNRLKISPQTKRSKKKNQKKFECKSSFDNKSNEQQLNKQIKIGKKFEHFKNQQEDFYWKRPNYFHSNGPCVISISSEKQTRSLSKKLYKFKAQIKEIQKKNKFYLSIIKNLQLQLQSKNQLLNSCWSQIQGLKKKFQSFFNAICSYQPFQTSKISQIYQQLNNQKSFKRIEYSDQTLNLSKTSLSCLNFQKNSKVFESSLNLSESNGEEFSDNQSKTQEYGCLKILKANETILQDITNKGLFQKLKPEAQNSQKSVKNQILSSNIQKVVNIQKNKSIQQNKKIKLQNKDLLLKENENQRLKLNDNEIQQSVSIITKIHRLATYQKRKN